MSRYSKARFLRSGVSAGAFGDDSGAEIAFTGRSNSGKSSALNAIVRRQNFARTSRTPGRTRFVNLFELEPGRRVADLPGYGHARVPDTVRAEWGQLMEVYFSGRRSLKGVFIVIDARRGIGPGDRTMLDYASARGLPIHVLLTKSDKLARREAREALEAARRALGNHATAQLFSAETGEGVDAARGTLEALWSGTRT